MAVPHADDSLRVTHLFLNPLLTGGADFDKQFGDDGITMVIEPRNSDDVFVPLARPIGAVITEAGVPGILAKWTIDTAEVKKRLVNTDKMRGFKIRLDWLDSKPKTNRVHLTVRYVTEDNRDLLAEQDVFIHVASKQCPQPQYYYGGRGDYFGGR